MNVFEKIAVATLLAAAIISAALFGVWEDKVMLYAPLLTLVYLALAMWVASDKWRVSGREVNAERKPFSSFIFHLSSFQMPPGGVCLLLFWLYSASMIPFSVLPYEAKISTLRFGCYLGTYWAAANILSRFPRRRAIWTTVFTVLVFIALYSLVQHRVDPRILFGMERYANYGDRLAGTYQCPNHIAHLFQMWLPFCLVFLFIPQFGWFWRICFAYAIPLFLLLIYQTQSRAGILGAIACFGATSLLLILRKSRKAFWIALLVVPLLCAGAISGLYAGSSMFRSRMQPVVKFLEHRMQEDVVEDEFRDFRPQTWLDTIDMIKARPVFGVGAGNYALTYEEYHKRFKAFRRDTVHAHNEYLEMTAEYGLVGATLVLCTLISLAVALIRFIRSSPYAHHTLPAVALLGALAGTAVHGFFDFELRVFPNAMMLALLTGCVVVPMMQAGEGKHSKRKAVIRWIFTGAIILAACFSLQTMGSAWIRARGDRLLTAGNRTAAEPWFKTAARIDPQNWPAQYGLGQIYFHNRYYELDTARKHELALKEQAAYEAAYRVNTRKEEVVYGLARAELFLGNKDNGLDYLRQVALGSRFNDFYWRKLGIELRKAGLYDEALNAFEQAQKMDRSNATVKRNIQWIKDKTGSAGGKK